MRDFVHLALPFHLVGASIERGLCMLFFYFCTKYPGEGKDHFQAKPCQSICPERHLTARVFGKHGLGSLMPPLYVVFVYLWSVES